MSYPPDSAARAGERPETPATSEEQLLGRHGPARRHMLEQRTAQLPAGSRMLYRIEHYGSLPAVALTVTALVVAFGGGLAVRNFSGRLVGAFEVGVSAVTVVMLFAIQHTQGREQAATQRKLDELLRAVPGADQRLMLLEEAPATVISQVHAGHMECQPGDAATDDLGPRD